MSNAQRQSEHEEWWQNSGVICMAGKLVSTGSFAPIVMVSAIAFGQGKTTVTAALGRHLRNQGKRV